MTGKWKLRIIGHVSMDDLGLESNIQIGKGSLAHKLVYPLFDSNTSYDTSLEIEKKQMKVPVEVGNSNDWWLYRDAIVEVVSPPESNEEEISLRIKHFFLLKDKALSKIRREVEAFENMERLPSARRERIPEDVRMFVWQRDEGCCIKCGNRERLEYDHIIPVIEGGRNTARNIQLLCETCNRQKGKTI
jgi:HNH endonuclease